MNSVHPIQDYIEVVQRGIGKKFEFDPGQQTLLHDEIIKPEGRIHFAGEHASLYHARILGAFESGLRAAIAIHPAS